MSFWKSLFNKSTKATRNEGAQTPASFRDMTKLAISLIAKAPRRMRGNQLPDYLIKNGIPEAEAIELYLFLPMACARLILPEIDWLQHYFDCYEDGTEVERSYADNAQYQIMLEECDKHGHSSGAEDISRIALFSAEIDAINKLLHDGGELSDVKFTHTRVRR